MSQDQTEAPTRKKLDDARKKGQIPRSRDLALAAASVAATMAFARLGGHIVFQLRDKVSSDLARFGDAPLKTITGSDLSGIIAQDSMLLALMVGPVALAAMVAGVGMSIFQGGFTMSAHGLQLQWSRLSPVAGLKKLGFKQGGLDTVKTLITVAVIAYIGWGAVDLAVHRSVELPWMSPIGAAGVISEQVQSLLWSTAWALAFVAAGDYGLQRWRHFKSLKMTKQEVRDESKQNEGSAETKGRIRQVQRDMARRRMLNDVKRATVVITNPTHFAVALEYKRGMAAPLVLAKGQDHIALKIREKARELGIPIVENKPLARGLYDAAEIGDTIPGPLFAAVAEVLAQLIRLKQLML